MERLEVRKHLKDFWRCSTALALVILLGGLVLEEWSRRPRVLATGPYELTLIAACGSQLIDPPESGIGFVTKGGGGYTVSVRVNESLLKEAAEAIGFKRGRIDVYDNLYTGS